MSEPSKDTIYIDIDDEITSIIDKVRGSSQKVVALVLPKRAAVLQSVVNMKLLKKTADDEKKNIVLITSEAGLLPLAGSVGLYVAKTLQTKPALPSAPEEFEGTDSIDEPVDVESEPGEFDPKEASEKTVGELSGTPDEPKASSLKKAPPLDADETIDLNEDELAAAGTVADSIAENKKNKKGKKDKKLKVPNFISFRRWLLIGGTLLVLLIVGLILLLDILPKAVITVQTNNSDINSNLTLTLSTATKSLDASTLTVPATLQQVSKTNTEQSPATGQQNNGAEATGQVTLSLTNCAQPQVTVPSGTGISSNGLTFITQSSVTLDSVTIGTHCNPSQYSNVWSASVDVTAQSGGSQYNIAPATFTVAGYSNVQGQSSTAFSGGTDSIITIVAQTDVDTATQKLPTPDTSTIKQELQNDLQQAGLYALPSTFTAGTPSVSTSPSVGTQANNVTVTQTINYTMLGVPQSDLVTLIDNSVNQQINSSQQTILSNGLSGAVFTSLNQNSNQTQVSMVTTSTVGSALNINAIKKQIVGKKSGDVQSTIEGYPGVKNVTVHFSPFWVTSVPSNASKTTITILKQSGS